MEILDPKKDLPFKRLFGNPENERILVSLINAVLQPLEEDLVTRAEVLNPYHVSKYDPEKDCALDLKVMDINGYKYNIEMQAYSDEKYFQRALYYWSKLYSTQLKKGEEYKDLKPTVGIHILNLNYINGTQDYVNKFRIYNTANKNLYFHGIDFLQLYFVELKKFPKSEVEHGKSLKDWLTLFCFPNKAAENQKEISTPEVLEAIKHLQNQSLTGEEKELFEAREKWELDHLSQLATEREEGKAEGLKEGEKKLKEGKLAIAKSLKEKGLSILEIAQITGLAIEEVNEI